MNILIVDDEPLAIELLEGYVLKVPGFDLAGKCSNALEAFSILNKKQVDVIFLDINMPEISGMDLLKMLKDPPAVILTTAYTEYAVESYNYNVIDYLVKPITFDRFIRSVHKLEDVAAQNRQTAKQEDETLFVRSEGKLIQISLQRLHFVEGYKNYVRLWTDTGKIIVHNTMKNFEEYLEHYPDFLRVHKSYIVNIRFVTEILGNTIKVDNESIAIGATFRDNIQAILRKYKQL